MKTLFALRRRPAALLLRLLVTAAACVTALIIAFTVGYILIKGVPHLTPELFAPKYTSENVSMTPAIAGTLIMTALALALAAPLGIFSAVFLAEYARRGSKLVKVVRLAAETLSGIPSIIYGLFGALLFNKALGYSLLAGAVTLAIMLLPLIMRTAEEALLSVPDMYREGGFGLGAGRLRVVFAITLPAAAPGILAGVILAVGRAVGETAALIFTSGTATELPKSIFSSVRTLSVHMYVLSNEGFYVDQAYATAVVLLLLTAALNALSGLAARRLTGGSGQKNL
ncbi:MAG: phosphate ABC transporter permease PstA [Oscillospiraceae bacterium]|jgi:phosphate transport system permease protein|nr:phosphate ABC transporter permease PstA [Oscillospiraceae bacterium]